MQVKGVIRCNFISIRLTKVKKSAYIEFEKDTELYENLYTAGRIINCYNDFRQQFDISLKSWIFAFPKTK